MPIHRTRTESEIKKDLSAVEKDLRFRNILVLWHQKEVSFLLSQSGDLSEEVQEVRQAVTSYQQDVAMAEKRLQNLYSEFLVVISNRGFNAKDIGQAVR